MSVLTYVAGSDSGSPESAPTDAMAEAVAAAGTVGSPAAAGVFEATPAGGGSEPDSAPDRLAEVVAALFSNPARRAPRELYPGDEPAPPAGDPAGSAGAPPASPAAPPASPAAAAPKAGPGSGGLGGLGSGGLGGLGTSALFPWGDMLNGVLEAWYGAVAPAAEGSTTEPAAAPSGAAEAEVGGDGELELYCPPAVRDNVVLGEIVNEALVAWAEQVGIYPGQLEKVRSTNFGRLIMLTHPGTDDPDRLLAAAKCILAEWATDDHFLDDPSLGADPETMGRRMGVAYASVDPVCLTPRYQAQLDRALAEEPVSAAYRSAFDHLTEFATQTQVARLHHELSVMFLAYNAEATWRRTKYTPPVWEYLTHRWENSFLPPMVLVDPVAGYEVPAYEFADVRVRRAFATAGLASVVLNDLYSMSAESDEDFDLPKVIAIEEGCSPEEALRRSVAIHNELMHSYEDQARLLSAFGSPMLKRFLADIWAWLGGNRQWHATTLRYHSDGEPNST